MNKPVLIIGAGGHASVLIDILLENDVEIIGIVTKEVNLNNDVLKNIKQIASDDYILEYATKEIELVNGIGSLPGSKLRHQIFSRYKNLGYTFASVVSKNSIFSKYAVISEGVQIFPGSILNANCLIGQNTIINSGAIVEHDCLIGNHNHIAPGSRLSGGVKTDNFVHIGTGASIAQGVIIGESVIIGAGCSIVKDVESFNKVIPAKNTIEVFEDIKNER